VQEEERTKGKGFRAGMAFYRRGRVRGWRIRRGSLMEVELEWSLFLGARETLLRGGNGSIFHEVLLIYKMTALLFYQMLTVCSFDSLRASVRATNSAN
jgi:hypothetical protein